MVTVWYIYKFFFLIMIILFYLNCSENNLNTALRGRCGSVVFFPNLSSREPPALRANAIGETCATKTLVQDSAVAAPSPGTSWSSFS